MIPVWYYSRYGRASIFQLREVFRAIATKRTGPNCTDSGLCTGDCVGINSRGGTLTHPNLASELQKISNSRSTVHLSGASKDNGSVLVLGWS